MMKWKPRRISTQIPTLLILTLVWTLLWGDFSWGNVLGGLGIATIVVTLMPLPPIGYMGVIRPWHWTVLTVSFIRQLTWASFRVAFHALNPRFKPVGAIIGVQLRNPGDLYLTITSEMSSLIPGSLVIEAHRLTGMVYLHVLDLEVYGGEDKVRSDVQRLEERVLRAYASREELDRVGVRL